MLNSFSQKGRLLSFIMVPLLIAARVNAGPVHFFLHSSIFRSHISMNPGMINFNTQSNEQRGSIRPLIRHNLRMNYPLYSIGRTEWIKIPDTPGIKEIRHPEGPLSRYIHREKNSDLVIVVPYGGNGKYRVRFFDEEDRFLFEVRQIRDSILIVEKLNFQHAGLFQYELYRGECLVERNTFVIKKD